MTARRVRRETSAGGIVIRHAAGGIRYLIIRDSHQNWGFPKGHREEGESLQAAAVREVAEEAGVREVIVRAALRSITWNFTFRGAHIRKTCHFFLMEARTGRTRPQRAEGITACRWVSFAEAHRRVAYANARSVLRRAHAIASTLPGAVAPEGPGPPAPPSTREVA